MDSELRGWWVFNVVIFCSSIIEARLDGEARKKIIRYAKREGNVEAVLRLVPAQSDRGRGLPTVYPDAALRETQVCVHQMAEVEGL